MKDLFTPMEPSPRWGRRASLAFSGNKRVIAYSFLAILAVAALALATTTLRRPPSADVVIDTEIESGRHLTFVLMAQQVAPETMPDPAYVTQVRAARDSLRALATITVGQTSWTSEALTEVARFEGRRSVREWAARGFSLNLDGRGTEGPNSSAPREEGSDAPTAPEPIVMQSENPGRAIWRLDSMPMTVVRHDSGGASADRLKDSLRAPTKGWSALLKECFAPGFRTTCRRMDGSRWSGRTVLR